MEERMLDMETKMAYQENTIKELSDIIYEQQKKIDLLEEKIGFLIDQFKGIADSSGGEIRNDKPPHY